VQTASKNRVLGSFGTLRSEGLAANSPVREGGVDARAVTPSAEGASRFVPALRASGCH